MSEYKIFIKQYFNKKWKSASEQHVRAFLSHLYHDNHLAPTTIKTYVTAISYHYKIKKLTNITEGFAIEQQLKNFMKHHKSSLVRHPITKEILDSLLQYTLDFYPDNYFKNMFYVIYNWMFKMALRISEITNHSKNYNHAISLYDVSLNHKNHTVNVTLRSFKHSKGDPITYKIQNSPTLWKATKAYKALRGPSPGSFFLQPDGKHISKLFFTKNLKNALNALGFNEKHFNSHSFRIGRASSLAENGASQSEISIIGRWNSEAYRKYIKPTSIHI